MSKVEFGLHDRNTTALKTWNYYQFCRNVLIVAPNLFKLFFLLTSWVQHIKCQIYFIGVTKTVLTCLNLSSLYCLIYELWIGRWLVFSHIDLIAISQMFPLSLPNSITVVIQYQHWHEVIICHVVFNYFLFLQTVHDIKLFTSSSIQSISKNKHFP